MCWGWTSVWSDVSEMGRVPFSFAVVVTHLEGEELMVGRSRHIAFAGDPARERSGRAY